MENKNDEESGYAAVINHIVQNPEVFEFYRKILIDNSTNCNIKRAFLEEVERKLKNYNYSSSQRATLEKIKASLK